MENLTPTIIKRRWADEVDDDEYASDGCHNGEDAICKTGVSTVHVDQLRAVAAALLDISSDAPKQQEGITEDGNDSPCCVLSCQASAVNSRSSTAPSSPRGQTEVCSTGSASVPRHLQAPAAQPTTARERLQEAMRKYGFGCSPSECAADAQVTISIFASRDCRVHGKPVDTVKEAAGLLQQAHYAHKAKSARPAVLSSQASIAPSSSRSQTETWSTGPASLTTHLQAPAAQPTTARKRLEEAMRKHGFGLGPSECAADAQVSIDSFANRDCRIHGKPVDTIKDAARVLQQAHDAHNANSARPATSQPTPVCSGSSCRSAGGVPTPPTSIPATAQHQPQKACPTGRLPMRSERGESAHESGARSAVPLQPTEHDIPRSTIRNRPARGISLTATAKPSMPGGLRMLQQIVRASAAERGCPPSRRGQPARQQQQQQEALSAKAAHPQDMPALPCAADPAQLHEQFAIAPSGEPLPDDAEASPAVAAMPAEQQEETSCPSSTQAGTCTPAAPLQFGTLAWDSSRHCAMEEQPDVPQQQPHVHMQPPTQCTAAGTPICFGSFTEQDTVDLQLFEPASQPTQQHMSPTAGDISVEAVPQSSSGNATQQGELAVQSTSEVMLDSRSMDQLTWQFALPLQACSLAQTCSRWLLPQKLQLPLNMAVDATISVLAATAAVDFYKASSIDNPRTAIHGGHSCPMATPDVPGAVCLKKAM